MSEYTAGPWRPKAFDEAQTVILAPNAEGRDELLAIVSVGRNRPHGEANAALISASPDLLTALAGLLNCLTPVNVICCDCKGKARAALDKARGGQP